MKDKDVMVLQQHYAHYSLFSLFSKVQAVAVRIFLALFGNQIDKGEMA